MWDDIFQSSTSASLLLALLALLVLHRLYSTSSSQEGSREPPGPKPLPLLGNVLQMDLKRIDAYLFDVRPVILKQHVEFLR